MKLLLLSTALILGVATAALPAQTTKDAVVTRIDQTKAAFETIALKIWGFAEVGYKEKQSSGLLQEQLRAAGFTVETGLTSARFKSCPAAAPACLSKSTRRP